MPRLKRGACERGDAHERRASIIFSTLVHICEIGTSVSSSKVNASMYRGEIATSIHKHKHKKKNHFSFQLDLRCFSSALQIREHPCACLGS